jgi:GTP-binding protein
VLTKTDQLASDEVTARCEDIIERLEWTAPWFAVSAVARAGLEPLLGRIMTHLEALPREGHGEGDNSDESEGDEGAAGEP